MRKLRLFLTSFGQNTLPYAFWCHRRLRHFRAALPLFHRVYRRELKLGFLSRPHANTLGNLIFKRARTGRLLVYFETSCLSRSALCPRVFSATAISLSTSATLPSVSESFSRVSRPQGPFPASFLHSFQPRRKAFRARRGPLSCRRRPSRNPR